VIKRTVRLDWSLRYGVIGIYKDRDYPLVHIYPVPFVRISLGSKRTLMDRLTGGWLG
jgi:hypothetical protein